MKRKILIAVLSFVLLFVGFIPVMNASTYSGTPIVPTEITQVYINTNLTDEEMEQISQNLEYYGNSVLENIYGVYQLESNGSLITTILFSEVENGLLIIFRTEYYLIYSSSTGFDYELLETLSAQGLIGNVGQGIYLLDYPLYIELNEISEVVGNTTIEGQPVGNQNEKVSSILSKTMFTETEETTYTPLVFNMFETIGNIASGFGVLVVSLFTSAFNLIYNNGTLTPLGIIILISLATGLLIWAFVFIRRLIKIRSK